ncbi:xanthine dehydrogenase family protein molybdopterin-binding subunit [Irregularibacter muris]|uniref:Xanthine dehydrogenase family protein molybdopterin-binding subunit n=1 Tax=Irregularibacter muris TaxID=1796619 RepID=A0AAE3HCE3_9FIRM|nr:xanthine dehydrogenase family protein molybdopterin-binding subunit [Irregularibacter muris]MCR1897732.1 xanthine dehydrogenase family protein molybdopterin-binding subunit [Irregularibacter muris]
MNFVGQSVKRVDGVRKATGYTKYADDIKMSKMLYAKAKRSPLAHARIVSIDTSKAEALSGVKAIITGQDVKTKVGLYLEDKTFLAVDKVRYVGEAVAAVAAETEAIAEEACDLIEVEYEELPGVFSIKDAIAPDASLVHEELGDYKHGSIFFPEAGTNIANHYKIRKGDIDKGFAEADFVFENEYYVPQIQHSPIETHCTIAQAEPDGKINVWAGCQSPYAVRKALAAALHLPLHKVRVVSPQVGGGFGGKAGTTLEGIVIPLAQRCLGRPVKMTYTREEEFIASFVRQGLLGKMKTGVNKEGKIVAQEIVYYWDGGAYTEYGVNIARSGGYSSVGPYDVPNVKADSICVYTNHPVGGPYRGFGMSEIHFCIEQNMDAIAAEMGMDPAEFRKLNCLKDGGHNVTGQEVHNVGLVDCIDAVTKDMNWDQKVSLEIKDGKIRGKGISLAFKAPSMPNNVPSSSIIRFNEDGTAHLSVTAMDIGQGSDTALVQIASEVLQLPPERILMTTGDTENTPYEWQTVASRITYCAGNAVYRAAEDAKNQFIELAAEGLGVSPEELELKDGAVVSKTDSSKKMPFDQLSMGLTMPDGSGIHGPIIGRGAFIPPEVKDTDPETGQGEKPTAFWTYGAQVSEVEIDVETGHITVPATAAAFNVGKVINPQLCEAQIEGGIVQGIGSILWEEMVLDHGVVKNPSYVDYKIPTAFDIPEMKITMVEIEEPTGPFGARGVAEPAMVACAPSVANAVFDALEVRVETMPLTKERILNAVKQSKKVQELLKK